MLALLAVCLSIASLCTVTADNEYPDAKLKFSGFTVQYGQNGKIQGYVDIELEKINATGVGFTINFDKDCLVPSNWETNDEAVTALEAFKVNEDVFSASADDGTSLGYTDLLYLNSDKTELIQSSVNFDAGTMDIKIMPDPRVSAVNAYIGIVPDPLGQPVEIERRGFLAGEGSIKLGRLSFQIKKPLQVSKMTAAELNSILSVGSPADITYIGSDGLPAIAGTIESKWEVNKTLLEVEPTVKESTVTSYAIFGDGSENDLTAYLNQYMRTVVQKYSNSEQILDTMVWNSSDPSYTVVYEDTSGGYDPKGGTYTVTQNYAEGFPITVKVRVTPISLTGFIYDNAVKTFVDSNRPAAWADLEMPEVITAELSEYIDMFVSPTERPLQADWMPSDVSETLKSSPAPVSEEYTHTVDQGIAASEAWLTIPSDPAIWNVSVMRNVLAEGKGQEIGDDITAKVIDKTGVLEITVPTIDGIAVEDGTEFVIYFPNGVKIDTGTEDFAEAVITGGTAVITVEPLMESSATSLTQEQRNKLQSLINLAKTGFKLSAVPAGGVEGPQKPFSFNPRMNYYLDDDTIDGYIEKDYSEGRMSMFPVTQNQPLANISTYIAFPDDSTIPIAYHGQTGYQPSELSAAKVDSWVIEEYPTAAELPGTVGETVTLVGTLSQYTYTDFGLVQNPDLIQLKIKVTVDEALPDGAEEKIKITTPVNGIDVELDETVTFNYNTRQAGYPPDLVQYQPFTIENIGTMKINGLTLRLEGENSESFTVSAPLPTDFLDTAQTASFTIRPKRQLEAGEYTAKVIVGSNMNANLKSFTIKFKVTDGNVYTVKIGANVGNTTGCAYLLSTDGTNTQILSDTYTEGETVNVYAVIVDTDYLFETWKCDKASVSFTDADSMSTDFTMPGEDVEVTASFIPSGMVSLRLVNLQDFNKDGTLNDLRSASPPYPVTTYTETVESYRVIVDGDVEENKVKFKLKNTDITTAITVEVKCNGTACAVTSSSDNIDHESALFGLNEGLNTVTVTTKYIDPSDAQEYSKTYTLTIYRQKAVDVDVMPGNSPYGLIDRDIDNDTSFADDASRDAARAAAKNYFHEHHTYDRDNVPENAANTYLTMYYTDAWDGGANYDEVSSSLFVYENLPFADPGFKNLKNADGQSVDPSAVKRTIKLDTYTQTGSIPDDLLTVTTETFTIDSGGETCVIDLDTWVKSKSADRRIRPGAYTMEYSFTDTDNSTRKFTRPVIVISQKGDATLDHAVGADDYTALYSRVTNGFYDDILASSDAWTKIYAYRVCDVTEDRNVNTIDANAIKNASASITPYYETLPQTIGDTLPVYTPPLSFPTVPTAPPKKAVLTLDYLGNGAAPTAQKMSPNLTEDDVGRRVWIGVGIKNPTDLTYFQSSGLYSADFAVDYDPAILEPCTQTLKTIPRPVPTADPSATPDPSAAPTPTPDPDATASEDDLYGTVREFNIDIAESATSYSSWSNADIYRGSYTTDKDFDASDAYKTEYVTILSTDGTDLRMSGLTTNDNTIYLLRLPFKLKAYPSSSYTNTAVTLRLNEQTFVLGGAEKGVTPSASWEGASGTKTTDVNNLYNHLTLELTDLFDTGGKFDVTGTLRAWNPLEPFKVEMLRTDESGNEIVEYTFSSDETDLSDGTYKYGETKSVPTDGGTTLKGFCEWTFKLPVSNRFNYTMVVKKMSHLTDSATFIDRSETVNDAVALTNPIELIVGDINGDGEIKHTDRSELIRFFNRQRAWNDASARFRGADLNGDKRVNAFDLSLLERNYEKTAPVPEAAPDSGSEGGGG